MDKNAKSTRIPKDDSGLLTLEFSYNWNNKLFTDNFTTIRLWNPKKYIIGREFKLITPVKGKVHNAPTIWGQAKLIDAKKFTIPQINNYIAFLDTGYDAEQCKTLMKTMYKNMIEGRDIELEPFGLYLLQKQYK